MRPFRGLMLGFPGAGKGTLSTRINKILPSLTLISSGNILRAASEYKPSLSSSDNVQNAQSAIALQKLIAAGQIVPDQLVNDLVMHELNKMKMHDSFLLDGYPRTLSQAETLEEHLETRGMGLSMVLNLVVPREVLYQRIQDRWIHLPSGRTYNLSYNPPKTAGVDDVTGEPLVRRSDDTVEALEERLNQYERSTKPLIDYYQKKKLLRTFTGSTSDEIFPQMQEALSGYLQEESSSKQAVAA